MFHDITPTFLLLNCDSTLIKKLVRAITDLNVKLIKRSLPIRGSKDPKIPNYPMFNILDLESSDVIGIIISGSKYYVNGNKARLPPNGFCSMIIEKKIPILGICYGHEMLAKLFGATIIKNPKGVEKNFCEFTCVNNYPLFLGFRSRFSPYFHHKYQIISLHPHFEVIGSTPITPIAAYQYNDPENSSGIPWLYGVQFHPENSNIDIKNKFFHNFLEICINIRSIQKVF